MYDTKNFPAEIIHKKCVLWLQMKVHIVFVQQNDVTTALPHSIILFGDIHSVFKQQQIVTRLSIKKKNFKYVMVKHKKKIMEKY